MNKEIEQIVQEKIAFYRGWLKSSQRRLKVFREIDKKTGKRIFRWDKHNTLKTQLAKCKFWRREWMRLSRLLDEEKPH